MPRPERFLDTGKLVDHHTDGDSNEIIKREDVFGLGPIIRFQSSKNYNARNDAIDRISYSATSASCRQTLDYAFNFFWKLCWRCKSLLRVMLISLYFKFRHFLILVASFSQVQLRKRRTQRSHWYFNSHLFSGNSCGCLNQGQTVSFGYYVNLIRLSNRSLVAVF